MSLSYNLISQFAKITSSEKKTKQESNTYGTIVKYGNTSYVRIDGSDLLTPYTSTIAVKDGDKVSVKIKNHTVTVTGSTSNPAASDNDLGIVRTNVERFKTIVADKVAASDLEAINAYIQNLDVIAARVENFEAGQAKIDDLKAKYANIEYIDANDIKAINADLETLKSLAIESQTITTEDLNAMKAQITNLTSYNARFTYVSADVLKSVKANIQELDVNKLDANTANILYAKINQLAAIEAGIQQLTADKLNANDANILYAKITELHSIEADINRLFVDKLDARSAEIKYANIDFENVNIINIGKLFAKSGVIKDVVTQTGTVTGELVGVTIKGDLIEGNTLKADKLVIQGEDGLYYKLNIDGLNNISTTQASKFTLLLEKPEDWDINYKKYYIINNNRYVHVTGNEAPVWNNTDYYKLSSTHESGLDGTNIIAQTITADKITVSDLVAFGATIGGFHIGDHTLYSGVKSSALNTTRGVFMKDNGEFSVGDSNNYFRYFYDENEHVYKMEISADSLKFTSSNKTIEETINDLQINNGNLWFNGQDQRDNSTQFDNDITISYNDLPTDNDCNYNFKFKARNGVQTKYFVPYDKNRVYKFSVYLKTVDEYSESNDYAHICICPYDVDKNKINFEHILKNEKTSTTLSSDLNPGDTIIHATDLSFWDTDSNNHKCVIGFYNYKPLNASIIYQTYTRNILKFCEYGDNKTLLINKTNNTITLQEPYEGPIIPSGTKIAQNEYGDDYIYLFESSKFILLLEEPEDWSTNYHDYYTLEDGEYVHVTGNEAPVWNQFILLLEEPEDWSTNYHDYYTLEDGEYVHVTGNEAPVWNNTDYYKLSSINYYELIIEEPFKYSNMASWTKRETLFSDDLNDILKTDGCRYIKFEPYNERMWYYGIFLYDYSWDDKLNTRDYNKDQTDTEKKFDDVYSQILLLKDLICNFVIGNDSGTAYIQDGNKFSFAMSDITQKLKEIGEDSIDIKQSIKDLLDNNLDPNSQLYEILSGISNKTSYVTIEEYNSQPCIILGVNGSSILNDFKIRITNTSIDFLYKNNILAYANSETFNANTMIVKNELRFENDSHRICLEKKIKW